MLRTVLVLTALLFASLPAAAQMKPAAIPIRPGAQVQADPQALTDARINQLTAKVKGLQSQVSTLQAQVKDLGAKQVSFQCTDPQTSANSRGVSEDCGPYTCEAVQGVCRTQCTSSDQCTSGTVCDIPHRLCVVP